MFLRVLPATITLNSNALDISGLGEAGSNLSSLRTAALLEIEAEPITHTLLDRAQARDVAQAFLATLPQNRIAKDWSFAGVGKGAEPLSSAPAGLTDQNSPLAWGTVFDPAGAGASSSSLREERGNPGEGHLTLKNTTITSGGKTTITSTGTTTFAHDTMKSVILDTLNKSTLKNSNKN